MISVTLTTHEYRYATSVAYVRNTHAKKDGKRAKLGSTDNRALGIHEIGCLGEVIAMNAIGVPVPKLSVDTYRTEPDIPPGACEAFPEGAEVRTRLDVPGAPYPIEMPIRPDDNPNMPFVMVMLDPSSRAAGRVMGWINAEQAMTRADWWKNPGNKPNGGAWFVPPEALSPVEGLLAALEAEKESGQ